jgi:hypothetical protein
MKPLNEKAPRHLATTKPHSFLRHRLLSRGLGRKHSSDGGLRGLSAAGARENQIWFAGQVRRCGR